MESSEEQLHEWKQFVQGYQAQKRTLQYEQPSVFRITHRDIKQREL